MRCEFCDGETIKKRVKRHHWFKKRLYIVENVDAEVCVECGEKFFHAKTLDAIDEFLSGDHPVKDRYEYNPHLPPVLRFADDPAKTDELPELLREAKQRPLSDTKARMLAGALRKHEPWMEWSGKREKPWFEVDPSPLHICERVSTQAILKVLAKEPIQRSLFADPEMEYHEAVKFYLHDVDWSNRMILGDSLQVMASLARQADLTREPEMVKAYRDMWTLRGHSYLVHLRGRPAFFFGVSVKLK